MLAVSGDAAPHAEALLAQLLKLTSRKEDFLTECVASVLRADARARRDYWRVIGAQLPPASRKRTVRSIRTQCSFAERSARCDLVLDAGAVRLAVEHKLTAAQGRDQLTRYLALPRKEVSHVAFVSADYQTIPKAVRDNPRFLRPAAGQEHFVWADIYPVLERSSARGVEVATATRSLFDALGLQPAHPLIGHLNTADPALRQRLDDRLYKAWQPLLVTLRKRWEYADSSIRKNRRSEIYVSFGPSDVLQRVWLDPFSNPGSLRVRLRSDRRANRDLMLERLSSDQGRRAIPHGRALSLFGEPESKYQQKYPWSVEVRIAWRVLLARATRESLPQVLRRFVLALMKAADPDSL